MTFGMSKARIGLVASMLFGLTACEEFEGLEFLSKPAAEEELSAVAPVAGDVTERDVEAPEIFSAQEPGLWDGRPSLGGVWVAYPGVKDPERVIIRNTENGQFVIGALFRRERENPGPKLQMSSDAAQELGMLAGQPTEISVIALRKEEVLPVAEPEVDAEVDPALDPEIAATSDDVEVPEEGLDADAFLTGVPATETIDATTLDTVEAATAAIDRASDVAADAAAVTAATPAVASAATAVAATPVAASAASASASGLEKPFIQIGIFSVKGNADSTADSLRSKGVLPIVKEQESQGKASYRVLVGPATNESERATLLATITDLGFSDSYFVTN